VLWRSGVALARDVGDEALRGKRVVELGCGLALPSIAAARAGATVLATDADPEAVELVTRNAELNGVELEAAVVDWTSAAATDELAGRGPFDLVLAADVLYERPTVARMLALLPRLAPAAWLADPSRPTAAVFLDEARRRGWAIDSAGRGVVDLHRLRFR
jgi:predicted nicotinamide N-methyase